LSPDFDGIGALPKAKKTEEFAGSSMMSAPMLRCVWQFRSANAGQPDDEDDQGNLDRDSIAPISVRSGRCSKLRAISSPIMGFFVLRGFANGHQFGACRLFELESLGKESLRSS